MKKTVFAAVLTAFTLTSCQNPTKKTAAETSEEKMPVEADGGIGDGAAPLLSDFEKGINEAHNKAAFMEKEAIAFEMDLNFYGKDRFDGTLTVATSGGKIRMDSDNGKTLLFDGENVYQSPDTMDTKGARFDIFTWPYFFAFPYKLQDEGANLQTTGTNDLTADENLHTFKLTFDAGTGDAPDDYYFAYLNPDNSLRAAGYIVTFGKSHEKAEESPHAIVYSDYQKVDGVPIARTWTFYNWNQKEGISGEPIGDAVLKNVRFEKAEEGFFEKGENAVEVGMPE